MTKKAKILVISEDKRLPRFLEQNLSGKEYLISGASLDDDVEQIIASEEMDLIVVDILMPLMDGIELSLRIRQLSDVPIMMLSTWGAPQDAVRGLDLSSESYLTSPIKGVSLVSQIESILRQ